MFQFLHQKLEIQLLWGIRRDTYLAKSSSSQRLRCQGQFTPLKTIEDLKELLFIFVIATDLYHIKN